MKKLLLLVVLSTLLAACSPAVMMGNAVRGSGNYATREYQLDGFTGITVNSGFKVTVTGGDAFKVAVTTDDNVLDVVSVTKVGNTLHIGFDTSRVGSINTTRLEAAVTMPTLESASLNGGAQLNVAQPAPKGVNLTYDGNGGSSADLSAMAVQNARVTLNGGARATIKVTNNLDYDLNGGAQLRYTGNPAIGTSRSDGGAAAIKF